MSRDDYTTHTHLALLLADDQAMMPSWSAHSHPQPTHPYRVVRDRMPGRGAGGLLLEVKKTETERNETAGWAPWKAPTFLHEALAAQHSEWRARLVGTSCGRGQAGYCDYRDCFSSTKPLLPIPSSATVWRWWGLRQR